MPTQLIQKYGHLSYCVVAKTVVIHNISAGYCSNRLQVLGDTPALTCRRRKSAGASGFLARRIYVCDINEHG